MTLFYHSVVYMLTSLYYALLLIRYCLLLTYFSLFRLLHSGLSGSISHCVIYELTMLVGGVFLGQVV